MKTVYLLLFFVIAFLATSCATSSSPQTESEYLKGYGMAREFAKKDAMNFDCFWYPRRTRYGWHLRGFNATSGARKYTKLLQEQGRSEIFIKGFYDGYEDSFYEFIDLYCT
jgi:hypothetical protein